MVISSAEFDWAPLRIIVPLTTWQVEFAQRPNRIFIEANDLNGLDADSAADFLQVGNLATSRFLRFIGVLHEELLEAIVAGVAVAIQHQR